LFLAGKPGQKQTLLAKKGKKKVPGCKTRTKTNIAGKKGKKIIPGWEKARTLRMLAGEKGC